MKLLLFNLRTDADDALFGHTTAWIEALASRVESIEVVTMSTGRVAVPPNVTVHSLGGERGLTEARRGANFFRLCERLTRSGRIDACFAHMAPLFALMFAPLAKVRRIPILLWYAHRSVTPTLRAAERVVDGCLSASPEGFRLPSRKLEILGHGIDTERFAPPEQPHPDDYGRTVLSVSRISPVKRLERIVEAVALASERTGVDLRLRLHGAPAAPGDEEYLHSLRELVRGRGLEDRVQLAGALPYGEVPAAYRGAAWFANLSETGAMDKAILEAMASGCVPFSRNASFQTLAARHGLEELVPGPGAAGLADALAAHAGSIDAGLRDKLREIVVTEHGLDSLADSIAERLGALTERRRRGHA